jgi:hypothetical protein
VTERCRIEPVIEPCSRHGGRDPGTHCGTVTSTPLIASPHVAATTQLPHVLIVPCHPAALWILVATPPVLRTLELNAALGGEK